MPNPDKKPAHELILDLMEREFTRYPYSGEDDQLDITGRLEILSEVLCGMIIPEKVLPSVEERKETMQTKFRGCVSMFAWEGFCKLA